MKGYAYYANYTIKENSIIDESSGWDVMSTWETPIMQKHADIVCANGGHILEFGFGMGISANLIQEHNIESHTIIEINDTIYDSLVEWAKDKPNVIAVKGDWYEDIPTDKKYDGVFYDGFGDMLNKRYFPTRIMQHCKQGTILTWYNNLLKEESQYDGSVKTMNRTEKGVPLGDLEQFKNTERITYETVSLTIPDEARIKWYLQGEGNTYYAPKLVVDNNDL
tara:strand:+ start:285 stop:950 length:666 start_codon:yes stop_codon:yes gene_type:complete